jgi:hypothetical protein
MSSSNGVLIGAGSFSNRKLRYAAPLVAAAAVVGFGSASFGAVYPGNAGTGFGGPVGLGSLTITDTPTSMTITLNKGTNSLNDALALYLDTQAGGFFDNSTFNDNNDGGRTALSGANNGNPSRSLLTLPFAADYGIAIENGFIGVFQLASGGNNSFNFLFGQSQSGNGNDPTFSITMTAAQMAQIGLTAGSGQSFNFVGSYISTSAYRSNETIGASVTAPGDGSGNAGFANPQSFQEGLSYTLTTVPEPTTASLLCVGGFMLCARRRRD